MRVSGFTEPAARNAKRRILDQCQAVGSTIYLAFSFSRKKLMEREPRDRQGALDKDCLDKQITGEELPPSQGADDWNTTAQGERR